LDTLLLYEFLAHFWLFLIEEQFLDSFQVGKTFSDSQVVEICPDFPHFQQVKFLLPPGLLLGNCSSFFFKRIFSNVAANTFILFSASCCMTKLDLAPFLWIILNPASMFFAASTAACNIAGHLV